MMGRLIAVIVVLVCAGFTLGQTASPDCAEMKTRLDRAEARLKDWPALARYSEENLKTVPASMDVTRVSPTRPSISPESSRTRPIESTATCL